MAPLIGTNSRMDTHQAELPKKRRKLSPKSTLSPTHKQIRPELRADELNWTTVTLPERLEDAEGFFGLDEVEGVEVLRSDGADKPPRFKVAAPAKGILKQAPSIFLKPIEVPDEDEWLGISDKDDGGALPTLDSANGSKKKDSQLRQSRAAPSKSVHERGIQSNVDFTLLEDGQEEDGIDISSWGHLGLSEETLSGVSGLKFGHPTPIQSACIPEILRGSDVIGKASTGSGKTLAFGIPILEYFLKMEVTGSKTLSKTTGSKEQKNPIALILSPTRELAHQLTKHLTSLYSTSLTNHPRIATVTGGLSLHKQQRLLENADLVIGTPGRLWEVISQQVGLVERLRRIKFLVVDEADRLLSEGHFKEVEEILDALDRETKKDGVAGKPSHELGEHYREFQRQTLVFSATFHKSLQQKLSGKLKHPSQSNNLLTNEQSLDYLLQKLKFLSGKPKFIDMNPSSQMAVNLQEALIECGAFEKDLYLYSLLLLHPLKTRTLVFTNSISSVKRLVPLLQALNLPALPLHSSMPQKARLRSVERYSSASKINNTQQQVSAGSGSILIATDVAARGLDIPNIDLIIHYHVPRTADMYVHRSGRTARASSSGKSILLCAPQEVVPVQRLVAKVHIDTQHTDSGVAKPKILRSLPINRSFVSRLQPRITLAQKITTTSMAKTKTSSDEDFLRSAAEELGVDYISGSDFEEGKKRGRGGGRKKKEKEDASVGKETVRAWRGELVALLKERLSLGGRSAKTLSGEEAERILNGEGAFLGAEFGDLWE